MKQSAHQACPYSVYAGYRCLPRGLVPIPHPPPPCVQGDQRTHSHVVALRAVTSGDGMTADWYAFTPAFMREVSTRICNKVRWEGQRPSLS